MANKFLMQALCLFLCMASAASAEAQVVISPEHEARAAELVSRMTLEEKIDYIAGVRSFYMRAVPRLGIPEIRMADGPCGIRNNTVSTLYPCGILTAAAWNRSLAMELGHGLGRDAKARGVSILLGPGVNIYRSPLCGRNYEYFGEDPYLAGETGKYYILGVQEEGVMATVKHFAANNQEWSRHHVSSDVDERTLHEIYFPAFRKAVREAGVGAVMDSYNLVLGVHSTENGWLNNTVLRDMWGFRGIVMSDWTSVYSTSGAANGGLDLECPTGVYFTREKLMPLIESGVVREETIDRKVRHILQTLIAFGMLDAPRQDTSIELDNPQSRKTALEVARHGCVLLKNEDNALPFRKGRTLVLGPNADRIPTGGGSGFVTPYSTVSVYDGLVEAFGARKTELLSDDMLFRDILPDVCADASLSERGFNAEYYSSVRPEGEPFTVCVDTVVTHFWKYGAPFDGMPEDRFSVVWTGYWKAPQAGLVRIAMGGDDGYRVAVDGKILGGDWGNHSYSSRDAFFDAEAGRVYCIRFEFFDNAGEATVTFDAGLMDRGRLEKALARADNVVYCAGFDSSLEGEGFDRPFELPEAQRSIMNMITSLHDNVAVVLNAGGGVDFNGWSENAGAVLMAWYPGQEGGRAVAEILSGKVSPSGKLPISIEDRWEDNPVYDSYYDRRNVPHKRVEYKEGVFVGYRGYDRLGKAPRYPFGYGLSYTEFEYSGLSVVQCGMHQFCVSFDITNTGKTDGWEVAQVYVCDPDSSVPRPEKELKGYEKVFVPKGCTVRVEIILDEDAFSFYDTLSGGFVVEPGTFIIKAGPSSAELPLECEIAI